MRQGVCLWVAAFAAMSCLGCGSSDRKAPVPTYPVSGTVTYKGKPVVDADVIFFNEENNRSAAGRTNKDGKYRLTTFNMNDGAVEGKSQVSITKIPPQPEAGPVADTESPDYVPPSSMPTPQKIKPKPEIPEKYFTFATSGLIATVMTEGENVMNFELED